MSNTLQTESAPLLMIGGAGRQGEYMWPLYRNERKNVHLVITDHSTSLNDRVQIVLGEVESLCTPLYLCGHSLGALIAYRVAQEASPGLVLGTSLVCPAMIGGTYYGRDWFEMTRLASNPFGMMRQLLEMAPRQTESFSAVTTAMMGHTPIGKVPKNVLVVGAHDDVVTPLTTVREVAKRIGGHIMEVAGGHNLPVTDNKSQVLERILGHLQQHRTVTV